MTALPFAPPIPPMLAKPSTGPFPIGDVTYEPKWDGFRALLFRDTDSVVIQPRRADDLAYAFPEVVAAALAQLPPGTVLDGELVSAHDGRLWFEELGLRLRPRSEAGNWKITQLSEQYPASFVAFDALAVRGRDLRGESNSARRQALERVPLTAPYYRSPTTADPTVAQLWFTQFEGAGLDGIIVRPNAAPYQPGKRVLLKIKHARTADVVVVGWRPYKNPGPDGQPIVGSLLLGLYDDAGSLHHVGVASAFSAARRAALVEELGPAAQQQQAPGAPSRWTGGKDLSWWALQTPRVAEVGYDHLEGHRFRHVASFKRWRPDRDPASCTYGQLERPVGFDLSQVLSA